MRKKTVSHVADTVFWYLLYLFPLIVHLLMVFNGTATTISATFYTIRVVPYANSVVYNTFVNLFGLSGVFPLFSSNDIFNIFTYYVSVYIIHLSVDFLLFIPRLTHKWMNKCYQEE